MPDVRCELRLGSWQSVLADETCDLLCVDGPYSKHTHAGHNAGEKQVRSVTGQQTRQAIEYTHWTPRHVRKVIDHWHERTRGWMAMVCDHKLIPAYEKAYERVGRYPFAPIPVIQPRPRLLGDGPASWAVYLMVARPRTREFLDLDWGCLDGAFDLTQAAYWSRCDTQTGICAGSKPLELMRKIVCDYSKPGDTVADLCSGGGTTLLAARVEGRHSIGAEMDPETFAKAQQRLQGTYGVNPRQQSLFDGGSE